MSSPDMPFENGLPPFVQALLHELGRHADSVWLIGARAQEDTAPGTVAHHPWELLAFGDEQLAAGLGALPAFPGVALWVAQDAGRVVPVWPDADPPPVPVESLAWTRSSAREAWHDGRFRTTTSAGRQRAIQLLPRTGS